MASIDDIKNATPGLLEVAQAVYNDWDQSDPDNDDLNGGGICHLIAEKIAGCLGDLGIPVVTFNSSVGVNHVWCICQVDEGVYEVDIPPGVYETGGGYTWKKIPDVTFDKSDLSINRLSSDPEDFSEYTDGDDY